jgi:hypothetical protein
MSKHNDTLPFPRGSTFYNGGTIDSASLSGEQFEGADFEFPDMDYSVGGGVMTLRSNRTVRCRILRNKSSGALLPKRFCKPNYGASTNQLKFGSVSGYCGAGDVGFVLDEYLPSAGCPDNDLAWFVVKGPSKVTTAGAGDTNFAAGDTLKSAANGLIVQADESQTGESLKIVGRSMETINAISTDFVMDVSPMALS